MIYYTFKFLHYPMWLLPVPAMPFVCTQVVVTGIYCVTLLPLRAPTLPSHHLRLTLSGRFILLTIWRLDVQLVLTRIWILWQSMWAVMCMNSATSLGWICQGLLSMVCLEALHYWLHGSQQLNTPNHSKSTPSTKSIFVEKLLNARPPETRDKNWRANVGYEERSLSYSVRWSSFVEV